MFSGSRLYTVAFYAYVALLLGCSATPLPEIVETIDEIDSREPAALLAASRSATESRLMREVLRVDDQSNLCQGLVSHNRKVLIERIKKPPFDRYVNDVAFGTRLIRISDSDPSEVHKPLYSSIQAWNADESLLILRRVKPWKSDYVLLDGQNYRFIRALDLLPSDERQLLWSHTDPDILYYVSKEREYEGWFVRFNVRSNERRRVRDFGSLCTESVPDSGLNAQMQSLDNDLFGFRCETAYGPSMLSYRMSTNNLAKAQSGGSVQWSSDYAPMPAPSGQRMEMQGRVVSPQLDQVIHKLDQAVFSERGSLGLTFDGADALFQTVFDVSPQGCDGSEHKGVAHLTEFNLENGQCRAVISQSQGWPYTTTGTDVSAVSRHRPGWVALSSVGYDQFEFLAGSREAPALTSEIYLVNTDPANTQLCRLAHHRSYAKAALNANYPPQLGEPQVTISPSGTRILFGSDWYDSGSVDSYVIELPGFVSRNSVTGNS